MRDQNSKLPEDAGGLERHLARLLRSKVYKSLGTLIKILLFTGLGLFLFYRLGDIGWTEVWHAMPDDMLFYGLLIVHFLLIPAAEVIIFSTLWRESTVGQSHRFLAFLRKQALNDTILGYSGDAYLLWWGRTKLGIDPKHVFHTVKDNTLLSAACSSSIALLVASTLLLIGVLEPLLAGLPDVVPVMLIGIGAGVVIVPVLALFGRKILGLANQEIRRVCSLHITRQLLSEGLLILQWAIVLPDVPIGIWFALIAARMVVTRIPMMPNRELTMLALAVALTGQLASVLPSAAALAGLFLARAGLMQVLNAAVLIFLSPPVTDRLSGTFSADGGGETAFPDVPGQ